MAYEQRDAAFKEWMGSRLYEEAIKDSLLEAFNAGWAARKKAEYEATVEKSRRILKGPVRVRMVENKTQALARKGQL